MTIQLFQYLHCPYCIRVRMALGYLGIAWDSRVLPYSDENTPLRLTQKKMLPILKDGDYIMNESLDIIRYLDKSNKLLMDQWNDFDQILDTFSSPIYNLAMPFWLHSPEFDVESQKYFLKKKESKRGPFSELIKRRDFFEREVHSHLLKLEEHLSPYWQSSQITIKDIALAAQLWGLYSVPEFRFSDKLHHYLMDIKEITNFNYTDFFWRNP